MALASLANVFDPDVIVFGGGVMAAGDLLLDPARDELARSGAATDEPDAASRPPSWGPKRA